MAKVELNKVPNMRRYVLEFDGLRAVAILVVMAFHAFPAIFVGGFLGVECFFVLSGFLITSLLLAEYEQFGRVDFRNFYLRRVIRLMPALVVMLLLIDGLVACLLDDTSATWVIKESGLVMS